MINFNYEELMKLIAENVKTIFYPEEWLKLDMELSKTELLALILVQRHGEIIMSQIAEYISIPMSTATGIIDRLVKNGYLKRERSEADRRIVAIQLTDKGRQYMNEFKEIVSAGIVKFMTLFTEEEKATLYSIFVKVLDSLKSGKIDENITVSNTTVKNIVID